MCLAQGSRGGEEYLQDQTVDHLFNKNRLQQQAGTFGPKKEPVDKKRNLWTAAGSDNPLGLSRALHKNPSCFSSCHLRWWRLLNGSISVKVRPFDDETDLSSLGVVSL